MPRSQVRSDDAEGFWISIARGATTAKVIFLDTDGGLRQVDTFDLKPFAMAATTIVSIRCASTFVNEHLAKHDGIVITHSHTPPDDRGFKYNDSGRLDEYLNTIRDVEENIIETQDVLLSQNCS